MSAVPTVVLPVFAIILIGFAAGRARLLGPGSSEALSAFVTWVALPALLVLAMARTPVAEILHGRFIGAYLGGMAAVWALGALIGRLLGRQPAPVLVMQGMNAGFSNTGYMGIPLFLAAYGPAGLASASLATVMMSAVAVTAAVIGLELTTGAGRGVGAALGGVAAALARNPLVVAPVLGIAWSMSGLAVPAPLGRLLDLLGSAASPCALFAIGLFLAGRPLGAGLAEAGWIAALKLGVQPLATWGLARTLFPMDPFWTASAVLLAALPTGTLTFVVAQQYGVHVERTSAAILVSTVLSLATLSALLALYGPVPGR